MCEYVIMNELPSSILPSMKAILKYNFDCEREV